MSCIDASGALTPVAAEVLRALAGADGGTPEEVARATGVPLFRARASLRELGAAGLVRAESDRYHLSEQGRALLPA